MAVDRRANQAIDSLLESRYPGSPISNPGRAAGAGFVTLDALSAHDLLTAPLAKRPCLIDGLRPVAARLIDHIGDGALNFEIREIWVATMRRHLPDALERILGEAWKALRRALVPCFLVADFRRAIRARAVAGKAHRF